MNKLLFLLSISLVLTACTQATQDPDALPQGIMQAVEGTGAIEGGSWMPEIQQQKMPVNMK